MHDNSHRLSVFIVGLTFALCSFVGAGVLAQEAGDAAKPPAAKSAKKAPAKKAPVKCPPWICKDKAAPGKDAKAAPPAAGADKAAPPPAGEAGKAAAPSAGDAGKATPPADGSSKAAPAPAGDAAKSLPPAAHPVRSAPPVSKAPSAAPVKQAKGAVVKPQTKAPASTSGSAASGAKASLGGVAKKPGAAPGPKGTAKSKAPKGIAKSKAPKGTAKSKAGKKKSKAAKKPKMAGTLIKQTGSKRKPRGKRRFIEGELANVGSLGLTPWENRFGIIAGAERLGLIYYALIRPEINYTRHLLDRELSISLAAPVRIQLLDTRPERKTEVGGKLKDTGRFTDIGQVRTQDWDELGDYARIIRYINFGGKEEHFYLDVNAFKASSIGHGTVLKRYNPNLDLNRRRVSAQLDAFIDYGGFESYINSIANPTLMSGLAFIKPLSLINKDNYILRSFSVGATFTADVEAPLRNKLDINDADHDGRREGELAVNQTTFQPETVPTEVVSYGLSTEIKFIDTPHIDWKTYFDTSFLETGIPIDNPKRPLWDNIPTRAMRSMGMTWGNLLRMNFGRRTLDGGSLHAVRIRTELRQYDNNYLPSYFDTMYEVQRVQYSSSIADADLANGTKLQKVLGRSADSPDVKGVYLEASWKIGDYFATALALELNDRDDPNALVGDRRGDNSLFVHLEVPHVGNWQFLATYHRRTAETFDDLFKAEFRNNDIFILKARYEMADAIHFNMEALTPFGVGPDSLFRNTINFNINAEFGFSWGHKHSL